MEGEATYPSVMLMAAFDHVSAQGMVWCAGVSVRTDIIYRALWLLRTKWSVPKLKRVYTEVDRSNANRNVVPMCVRSDFSAMQSAAPAVCALSPAMAFHAPRVRNVM